MFEFIPVKIDDLKANSPYVLFPCGIKGLAKVVFISEDKIEKFYINGMIKCIPTSRDMFFEIVKVADEHKPEPTPKVDEMGTLQLVPVKIADAKIGCQYVVFPLGNQTLSVSVYIHEDKKGKFYSIGGYSRHISDTDLLFEIVKPKSQPNTKKCTMAASVIIKTEFSVDGSEADAIKVAGELLAKECASLGLSNKFKVEDSRIVYLQH